MNYEQTLKASKCNPAKVLKVLERLEWECSKCEGQGVILVERVQRAKDCQACSHTGKIHYSWTPQVGEWCIDKYKTPKLITNAKEQKSGNWLIMTFNEYGFYEELATSVRPVLEWEEIERVLEKAGYKLGGGVTLFGKRGFTCCINKSGLIKIITEAKSRQEAVMKAVLELGKENKNVTKI